MHLKADKHPTPSPLVQQRRKKVSSSFVIERIWQDTPALRKRVVFQHLEVSSRTSNNQKVVIIDIRPSFRPSEFLEPGEKGILNSLNLICRIAVRPSLTPLLASVHVITTDSRTAIQMDLLLPDGTR